MSTGQELKLKIGNSIPRPFQWVMASSASSTLTIGERNKKMNIPKSLGSGGGFPWWLPVIMLVDVYPVVVFLAMGHLTLFLPEVPFAAWEALYNIGYRGLALMSPSLPAPHCCLLTSRE
uniref:DUF7378 domain-containing protein n=1 Tax=Setaria viridis TaxID=4556 RepID=A0A4U6VK11_SETVI|nr:hypothetical protein SEVIR_2G005200v2 [Setaria viridis]